MLLWQHYMNIRCNFYQYLPTLNSAESGAEQDEQSLIDRIVFAAIICVLIENAIIKLSSNIFNWK